MTRTQITDLVIANTRRSNMTSTIYSAINLALTKISQISDFKLNKIQDATLSVIAEENTVSLPSDCKQVLSVRLIDADNSANSRTLDFREKTWIVERFPDLQATQSSWPVYCFQDGSTLYLVPPTNKAWNVYVEYYRAFPSVNAANDTVDESIEDCVINWVTAYIFKATQQYTDFRFWSEEFNKSIVIAIEADRRNRTTKIMEMHGNQHVQEQIPAYLDPFNTGSEDM